jgi:hypothetical protein
LAASTAVLVTVIDCAWFVTTLPDESRTEITGWVVKSTRFTNPDACLVSATRVASPKLRVMFEELEMFVGDVMLAVSALVPTVPSIRSAVKVARPAVALIALVPVKVVSAESEIVWVD